MEGDDDVDRFRRIEVRRSQFDVSLNGVIKTGGERAISRVVEAIGGVEWCGDEGDCQDCRDTQSLTTGGRLFGRPLTPGPSFRSGAGERTELLAGERGDGFVRAKFEHRGFIAARQELRPSDALARELKPGSYSERMGTSHSARAMTAKAVPAWVMKCLLSL